MDERTSGENPKLRALNLKAQAAEERVTAAKLYCDIAHLETTAANLIVAKFKHLEQAELATTRGQHYYDRMKEHEAALAKNKALVETLAPEIIRKREKAMKLSALASSHEKKSEEAEERARSVLGEHSQLVKEREKHVIEAKRLDAEAVRVESMF